MNNSNLDTSSFYSQVDHYSKTHPVQVPIYPTLRHSSAISPKSTIPSLSQMPTAVDNMINGHEDGNGFSHSDWNSASDASMHIRQPITSFPCSDNWTTSIVWVPDCQSNVITLPLSGTPGLGTTRSSLSLNDFGPDWDKNSPYEGPCAIESPGSNTHLSPISATTPVRIRQKIHSPWGLGDSSYYRVNGFNYTVNSVDSLQMYPSNTSTVTEATPEQASAASVHHIIRSPEGKIRVKAGRARNSEKVTFPAPFCHNQPDGHRRRKIPVSNSGSRLDSSNSFEKNIYYCVFCFANCALTFKSKNEWKRHIRTFHIQDQFWECGTNHGDGTTVCPSVFNRADLATQHYKRFLGNYGKDEAMRLVEEFKKSSLRQREFNNRRVTLPENLGCPEPKCHHIRFRGPKAWNERLEHTAKHCQTGDFTTPYGDPENDTEFYNWVYSIGSIQWDKQSGTWKSKPPKPTSHQQKADRPEIRPVMSTEQKLLDGSSSSRYGTRAVNYHERVSMDNHYNHATFYPQHFSLNPCGSSQ